MTLLFAFLIGLLFVRPVQIEFAFVLDEAEPKVIDPAASAQNIAPEPLMRCKVNS